MIFIINGLKKSLLLVIFIILIITGIITGCSRQQKTIQIGYNSWIGYEAIIIAEKNNFLKMRMLMLNYTILVLFMM